MEWKFPDEESLGSQVDIGDQGRSRQRFSHPLPEALTMLDGEPVNPLVETLNPVSSW